MYDLLTVKIKPLSRTPYPEEREKFKERERERETEGEGDGGRKSRPCEKIPEAKGRLEDFPGRSTGKL